MVSSGDIPGITDEHADILNKRQRLDYRNYRDELFDWLLTFGKTPDAAEGYARSTIAKSAHRIDSFHVFVWDRRGYTTKVSHDDADAHMKELARTDHTDTHKSNTQKAVKRVFKFRHHERSGSLWDPDLTFVPNGGTTSPREFLTLDERRKIREAALEVGTIPAYNSLSAEERDEWKAHVAQSLMKPKNEVMKSDWQKINGWKIPSMVWTSLDAGLRPVEVERATVGWVDTHNCLLRIPAEESSKNESNWTVALQNRTGEALDRWLQERETRERYDGTNSLWLTRRANPYQSQSLIMITLTFYRRSPSTGVAIGGKRRE